jgi:hypothetical protein
MFNIEVIPVVASFTFQMAVKLWLQFRKLSYAQSKRVSYT